MRGRIYTERKFTAGDLDRKVQVSQRVIVIDPDTKFEEVTYGTETELYANVVHMNASKEAQINGGLLYDDIIHVVIRFKSEYNNTNMRLRYNNLSYDIISCREVYGRRQWLILKCKYGGKQL